MSKNTSYYGASGQGRGSSSASSNFKPAAASTTGSGSSTEAHVSLTANSLRSTDLNASPYHIPAAAVATASSSWLSQAAHNASSSRARASPRACSLMTRTRLCGNHGVDPPRGRWRWRPRRRREMTRVLTQQLLRLHQILASQTAEHGVGEPLLGVELAEVRLQGGSTQSVELGDGIVIRTSIAQRSSRPFNTRPPFWVDSRHHKNP